jgi:acyl-CoA reductase-like NAD-dependent aldehyde dehydrogenase
MNDIRLLIGGKDLPASSGASFDRTDPVTGRIASRAAAATPEDADAAVEAARSAFGGWSSLPPAERRTRLLKAADLMEARTPEFIRIGVAETGAVPGWHGFNVSLAAGILREAASMTTQIGGEVIPSAVPGNFAMSVRQPAGVVLGIAPWNAPAILGTRAVAMPLACGNTAVLKGSEMSPGVHRLIGTVLQDAGLGDGVVNVVLNAPADAARIVERLIANPAVRRVNFTGSTRVGRIVGELAARYLKPALLELGGNNPLIVLDDADLDAAVEAAAFSAFMNQGQICMSAGRIVVDERIADAFVQRFAVKTASLKAGRPADPSSVLGALISPAAATRCREMIEDALARGARLAAGGGIDGAVMQPTIVDCVTPQMRLYQEESFGNLVGIVRVRNEEEALRVANDTEYGLSAAVFTRDLARGLALARRMESGICHINGPTVHDEPQMPFGGVKASGYGRFGGKAAIGEFTELRWITVQTGNRDYPI